MSFHNHDEEIIKKLQQQTAADKKVRPIYERGPHREVEDLRSEVAKLIQEVEYWKSEAEYYREIANNKSTFE